MINNNLLLEVKKIHNLMNITHNGLILESAAMANLIKNLWNKFGDDFVKLTTRITKKDKTTFNSIINKLKSNTQLLDNEVEFLGKYISWDKISTKAITDRTLFGQAFIDELGKSIAMVKTDPSKYNAQLKLWEEIVNDNTYDYIPKVVRNKIKEKIKERFRKAAGIVDDVTPGRKVPNVNPNLTSNLKQYIVTKLIPRNIQTLKRVVQRIGTDQKKLNDEFLEITKQAAESLSQGQTADYYFKKMSDILLSKKKSWNDGIEEMYKVLKKDKNIPADVNKEFTRSDFYKTLIENTKDKGENIFKELLSPWAKLVWPWGNKKGFLEWAERVIMFIVNLNASTLDEITLKLQKNGITGYLAQRIIAGYLTKNLIIPTIFAITKAYFLGWPLEQLKKLTKGKTGNPFGPKGKETFTDSFVRQFKTGFGGVNHSVYSYIPFGSLIDDIWNIGDIENKNTYDRNYSDENTEAFDEFINSENTSNGSNDLKFTNNIDGLVKWLTDVKKLNLIDADLPYIKSVGNNTYTYEDAEGKIHKYEYSGNTFQ